MALYFECELIKTHSFRLGGDSCFLHRIDILEKKGGKLQIGKKNLKVIFMKTFALLKII